MAESKQIQYLNKDFDGFKQKLLEFAEIYYPGTYNDFSEESAGLMLIEMASYVGDVLSFYADNQIQENFVEFAKQRNNLLSLAYNNGYFPQVTNAATAEVEVFQLVPATSAGGSIEPDFNYSMIIQEGAQIQSGGNTDVFFFIQDKIDFSVSSSADPTDISVYSLDDDNNPNFYLLKKTRLAVSGKSKTSTFSFGAPERFPTIQIQDTNIVEITSVTDSDGRIYYEVPYLAQETIFDPQQNIAQNDPNFAQYSDTTPFLLKIRKVPYRFISRFKSNNTLQLQFGSGVSSNPDETIIPNPDNIGLGLPYGVDKLTTAFDPSNFLFTKTYGVAPSNTTITVNYLVGGGAVSNVPASSLTLFSSGTISFFGANLDSTLQGTVRDSLAFNNPSPAVGGGDGDSNTDIRQKTIAQYPSQLRTVTKEDYIIRSLSLPSKFGTVYKAYITQENEYLSDRLSVYDEENVNALCLHILSKDQNGKLTTADPALKQNLKTYLAEYRMLTDGVSCKDAFIINIGVNFDVILLPNFNNSLVLNNIITELTTFFDTDKMQINQPILINNVRNVIDNVEGVQTVKKLEIINKVGINSGYSELAYDIKGATINEVLYPSLDPSIFELKFPETDIQGKVVTN
tara:strand:- start:192 stop:2069 length:1878 start_codon:yes stop_codon:yes gene_type:complete